MKGNFLILALLVTSVVIVSLFFQKPITPAQQNKLPTAANNPQVEAAVTISPSVMLPQSSADYDLVTVKRVVDGDTIELSSGQKVRYIGINTPETVDPRTTVQCFGKEASAKNKELVEGKEVRLEKDVSETDKYGRLLRYVYLEDTGKETFINQYLVAQGFAQASSYPPDVKYQDLFNSAQKEAQTQSLGLWSGCLEGKTQSSTAPPSGCNFKGNISSSGEKIYHLPTQKYYNSTVIDETKGEKYFCSTTEAEAAGFRASKI